MIDFLKIKSRNNQVTEIRRISTYIVQYTSVEKREISRMKNISWKHFLFEFTILINQLIPRNICESKFPRSQCKTREIFPAHRKEFSWNQLISNFFSKNVAFTKLLSKEREREFPQIPHYCCCRNSVNIMIFLLKKFRETTIRCD